MEETRFEELLSVYADGRATSEEVSELESLLRKDSVRRRTFVERMRLEADLNELLTGVDQGVAESTPSRGVRRVNLRRAGTPAASSWGAVFFTVAALLAVAVLAFALLSGERAPSAPRTVSTPPPAPRPVDPPEPPTAKEPPGPEPVRTQPSKPAPPLPRMEKKAERAPQDLRRKAAEAFRKAPPKEAPRPPAAPKPAETTLAAIAVVQEVEGVAARITQRGRIPVKQGDPILEGEGLRIDGRLQVRYADGTTVRFESGSQVEALRLTDRGKRVVLRNGALSADVKKQPAGQVMVFSSRHAEARVLGTELRFEADDHRTRLEVSEGRVRLRRRADGRSVLVSAGHFVVTAERGPLKAEKIPPFTLRISFGPAGSRVPPDYLPDDGAVFDLRRGWGWNRDKSAHARYRTSASNPLLARHIGAGGAKESDRWEAAVPNARYRVSVVCGDAQTAQGPHRVVVEGVPAIKDRLTAPGEYVRADNVVVRVRDGRLTLEAGAVGTTLTDPGGDTDTSLKSVVITRIP